ncbi:MAG: hypothetical protein GC154_18310 [bacterium]|nr:hypothetical protein [bacterium]
MKFFTFSFIFSAALFIGTDAVFAQNMTPKIESFGVTVVATPKRKPTPIRNLSIPVKKMVDARLEAIAGNRVVFSDNTGYTGNRRLYYWEPGATRLYDTEEDGIPGSVIAPDDGKYIIFLHNELTSEGGRDIDGDGVRQIILRLYHFDTRQVINLGAPARSATPLPGESQSTFQYSLKNGVLSFSVSTKNINNSREEDAPWYVIDMKNVTQAIEGTPTPTPVPNATPTPTPKPNAPTPTPPPTGQSDINGDGRVDVLDLLFLHRDWHQNK